MENPAEWRRAELIIADAYKDWTKATSHGAVGLSLPATIATRLREAGLLLDGDEPVLGWEGLRAHARERHES